ncbi:MAG: hypothetical protein HZA91_03565 [Verrucomicrobia bacterium]|nr:hypothetical protein [Verrucomicrobiota bacterium]
MTIIAFLALPVLLVGVFALLTRRLLQGHDARVRAGWARVQSCLEKRHELAGDVAAGSAAPDSETVQKLRDVLKQAEFVSGLAMKARVEDRLSEALHDVLLLGGDERFEKAAAALPEARAEIGRAAEDYNARVSDYNAAVERARQVARFVGYEPREPFTPA